MMKKTIALTLVLALGFQFLSKLGLLTFYHFYTEYVVEEYCENKDQPQLQCEGTCFLKKGLEDSHENDKSTSKTTPQTEAPTFIVSSYFAQLIILGGNDTMFSEISCPYLFTYMAEPFQPPKKA